MIIVRDDKVVIVSDNGKRKSYPASVSNDQAVKHFADGTDPAKKEVKRTSAGRFAKKTKKAK